MTGRWWRAYEGAVDDPKLQLMPPALFKSWFNLVCLSSANGGKLPPISTVAFKLHIAEGKAKHVVAELTARHLFDQISGEFVPHNWELRQYKSDVTDPTAAKRMRNYRNRRRNATVTVTPPRVQNTDSVAKATADEVVGEDARAKLFRLGKTILVSFGVAEKRTGALIGQWLKTRNDPEGLLAAIQFARDQNVAEPVAYISAVLKQEKSDGTGQKSIKERTTELADEWRRRERDSGLFGSSDDA